MSSTRSGVPIVVLFGRTNVGKSTIFNRLSSGARSLVFDRPHVTRDPIEDLVEWNDKTYTLIDTGGVPLEKKVSEIDLAVRKSIDAILAKTTLIVFVCDGVEGITADDRKLAQIARASGLPTIMVINKVDNNERDAQALSDFAEFGFKDIHTISAIHGRGFARLLDRISELVPAIKHEEVKTEPEYRVAIIGKPNVGKSSLLNLLLREERSLVSNVPGTTREAVRSMITIHKDAIEFADTAGIRRHQSVEDPLELLMVKTSFKVLKHSNLVVLMCDASEKRITDQELKLLFYAHKEHKSIVLVINKSDLITDAEKETFLYHLSQYEHLTKKIPVIWTSCVTHKNISKIKETIHQVKLRSEQEIDVVRINTIIKKKFESHPLTYNGEEFKVHNVRPIKGDVPTLVVHTNHPEWIRTSHLVYFENVVRSQYDLLGCPIKIIVRSSAK